MKKLIFIVNFLLISTLLIGQLPSVNIKDMEGNSLNFSKISNNGKPISMPHKKQAKKRLKIGCQLNFDVVIIINKIDNAKYKNIIILILY